MVIGHHQIESLLGLPQELTPEAVPRLAAEAARRFVRAYAV
jgi:TetR/AcrR family transcriptional repressor of mexJK operon